MRHFTLQEFIKSATAEQLKIDNTPTVDAVLNLKQLVNNVLEPARRHLGEPITITSGYRSRELNTAIHGAPASQHCTGHAADITCAPEKLKSLYSYIINNLVYDQVIYYINRNFIHISYVSSRTNRMQIIIKS